jgi:hypothetical protein
MAAGSIICLQFLVEAAIVPRVMSGNAPGRPR